jgi:hypothetical protein
MNPSFLLNNSAGSQARPSPDMLAIFIHYLRLPLAIDMARLQEVFFGAGRSTGHPSL